MTKPQLVAFIMENTAEYKKSHLNEKYKTELEVIAAAFQQSEIAENGTAEEPAHQAQHEGEISHLEAEAQNETAESQPGYEEWSEAATEENAPDSPGEPSDNVSDYLPTADGESTDTDAEQSEIEEIIAEAYDENKKIAKFRRADKNEFKETVIEKVMAQVAAEGLTDPQAIVELTISIITQYAKELIAFVPMNDNERKMLETIPLLVDYANTDSRVDGKNFLQKVKELHNIDVSSSRALMVSLKRKKYISIENGKETQIALLERGVKYLAKSS